MTPSAVHRPVSPPLALLATLGLLAGLILPGTSLAAAPVPSPTAAVVVTPSVAPSAAPGVTPTERAAVPEIFNPANPALVSPALTGVLPAGFQEQIVINGLSQPTNIEFAPNGKIFVAEKNGRIFEYDSLADTSPTQFADLSVEVMDWWDRGMLSMAIDPGLTSGRPYIYVLYAFDAPIGGTAPTFGGTSLQDSCPTPPGANPPNLGCVISGRLARLTVSGNGSGNTMVAGSEKVLINDWCQQYPSHSIGTVMMGADGQLWVTGGEGASFTTRDYGQYTNPCGDPPGSAGDSLTIPSAEGGALRAQDAQTQGDPQGLSGSLIRVDPDSGLASSDNPAAGSSDKNRARLLAYGLRNPFRFTFRPGTDEAWIGMVGNSTWESIFRDQDPTAGLLNFGWPCYEGPALNDFSSLGLNMCTTLYNSPSQVTRPYFAYKHSDSVVSGDGCTVGSSSISGLAFGVPGAFPSHYTNGGVFFSDYSRNCIWFLPAGANGLPDASNPEIFETNATGPVQLVFGPDKNLYFADYGGAIRRIIYSATNHTPVAAFTASATFGPTPLSVTFNASTSHDADPADTLSYSWDLNGDGTYGDATGVTASRTYTTRGKVTVRVRVSDNHGASSTAALTIDPGDSPPVVTLSAPTNATTWKVGDVINMTASATDAEDGTLPSSAYDWAIVLHHCYSLTNCHTHDLTGFSGPSGQLVAPDHGYPSYLEFDLTVTDSDGLAVTKVVTSYPKTVNLTFLTNPPGLQVYDGDAGPNQPTPVTRPVIIGSTVSVSAPTPQLINGISYAFAGWSDGRAQSHDLTAPALAASYTATYETLASTYHPVAPTRFFDTRSIKGSTDPLASGVPRQFSVAGTGGVPAGATAITGNLTVTNQTSAGYVSLTTSAQAHPLTSTLNFPLGDSRANGLTMPLNGAGALFATYIGAHPSDRTALVFDLTGYFTPDTSGDTYHTVTPGRVYDTRQIAGPAGPLMSTVPRQFPVSGTGIVPAGATAVTGNVTVTNQTGPGFVSLTTSAQAHPPTSTLNFPLGDSRANGVTMPLTGTGTLFATYVGPSPLDHAALVFDVTGYFTHDASGETYHTLTPARILDTRHAKGLSGPFLSGVPRQLTVTGTGIVPRAATAITGNLTVTNQTAPGFVSVTTSAQVTPATSTLNFPLNDSRANGVTVPLTGTGSLWQTFVGRAGSRADLLFDVTGYFAP
jgi:PKD repeat protein/glucose/arabinose dehydrogenase